MIYNYFIFVSFKKVAAPLLDKNKAVFEILLKDMAMKSLVLQSKLMALVMLYLELLQEEIFLFTVTKQQASTCRIMQLLELNSIELVKTWNNHKFKAFCLTKMNHIIH